MENPKLPPRDLFRTWGESVVPVEDASASRARRARIVSSMASAISAAADDRARTRRRARVGYAFASAAIGVLGIGVAWHIHASTGTHAPSRDAPFALVHATAGSVRATHGAGAPSAALASGDSALGAGDEVTTGIDGRGDVTLSDGVTISLEGASDLRLPSPSPLGANAGNEQVHLDVGIVHIRVPRMQAGHTFSVKTPDAEVTVHGTAFTVEVAPLGTNAPGAPSTRVRVSEGIVSVASDGREVLLTAGMEWPVASSPIPPMPSAMPNAPIEAPPTKPSASTHRGHVVRSEPKDAIEASSLAEQNTLLAQAMDASRGGDDSRAIALLSDLLTRHPSSPLAQEARVQRFRALERSGNHRGAAREARLYLAAYPTGFARDEAKQLALEP